MGQNRNENGGSKGSSPKGIDTQKPTINIRNDGGRMSGSRPPHPPKS